MEENLQFKSICALYKLYSIVKFNSNLTFGTTNDGQPSAATWWDISELHFTLSQSWQVDINKTPDKVSSSEMAVMTVPVT